MSSATRIERAARIAIAVLALVGLVAGLNLFFDVFEIFIDFSPGPHEPATAEQIHRYEILTAVNVGCFFAVAVLTMIYGRPWQRVLTVLLLMWALGWAAVFSIPSGRWFVHEETSHPLPSNYHPCYSGSRDCGHGG